jgi:hypothetical protein
MLVYLLVLLGGVLLADFFASFGRIHSTVLTGETGLSLRLYDWFVCFDEGFTGCSVCFSRFLFPLLL